MEEKYLPELMAEKDSLDPSFTHALRLVNRDLLSGFCGSKATRSGVPLCAQTWSQFSSAVSSLWEVAWRAKHGSS